MIIEKTTTRTRAIIDEFDFPKGVTEILLDPELNSRGIYDFFKLQGFALASYNGDYYLFDSRKVKIYINFAGDDEGNVFKGLTARKII